MAVKWSAEVKSIVTSAVDRDDCRVAENASLVEDRAVRPPSDAPRGVYVTRLEYPVMADILAENLSGKAVMGADGTELGMLYNITMDLKTGALADLVVDPHEALSMGQSGFDRDDSGRIRVPVGRVQAVKDYIVVQR
jgi:sporulation protein YlmC with PRC-barrel domain